jgi:hypothetical protein
MSRLIGSSALLAAATLAIIEIVIGEFRRRSSAGTSIPRTSPHIRGNVRELAVWRGASAVLRSTAVRSPPLELRDFRDHAVTQALLIAASWISHHDAGSPILRQDR